MTLREEVTELLRELIRVDTVNPPGKETAAAELLREYLGDNGVGSKLYALDPQRANLVARLPGAGTGPSLLFLSHTDTVLADRAEWTVDPWAGELHDGFVWGRGALDMKGQVAASAVAIASLAREGFEPVGDLVFAATADEESDTDFGLSWLCEAHPEAVRTDFAINEGGGARLVLGGRPVYLCSVAEKMTAPFRLAVHGRSGHASMPAIADNALVKAARLVTALGELRVEPRHIPETEALLELLVGEVPPPERAVEVARDLDPQLAEIVEPLLAPTFSPTIISASPKRNVIPGLCEVIVDSRLPPGLAPEDSERLVRGALGEDDYDFEFVERKGGSRSPAATPLWAAVESFVVELEPGALLAPLCVAGFTDSHYLRDAFGTVAYGFFPMRAMTPELAARLIHSADERVPIDDLELGLRFLRETAVALCGG